MEQEKLSSYWKLEEGDKLKGKKIAKIRYLDDEYRKTTSKVFELEDGSEWMLSDEGLEEIEHSKT